MQHSKLDMRKGLGLDNNICNSTSLSRDGTNFFQTFSKTIISFSRLKVIKKVSNRDLKKSRNKALSIMHCRHTGKIEYNLTRRKKISLVKHLLQFSQFFPDFSLHFRLFQGLEDCWANFNTLTDSV